MINRRNVLSAGLMIAGAALAAHAQWRFEWTAHPNSVEASPGGEASLHAEMWINHCEGGTSSYEWLRNGSPVQESERVRSRGPILLIRDYVPEDAGVYRCVVWHPSVGVHVSNEAVISTVRRTDHGKVELVSQYRSTHLRRFVYRTACPEECAWAGSCDFSTGCGPSCVLDNFCYDDWDMSTSETGAWAHSGLHQSTVTSHRLTGELGPGCRSYCRQGTSDFQATFDVTTPTLYRFVSSGEVQLRRLSPVVAIITDTDGQLAPGRYQLSAGTPCRFETPCVLWNEHWNQCEMYRMVNVSVVASFDLRFLTCPADVNRDGGVDGSDIPAFFETWDLGDPSADVNSDGGVDGQDLFYFFERWQAGC